MSRIVNRKDLDFLLYDVLDMDSVFKTERYGSYDRDSVSAMLDTAQQIAEEVYLPSASEVDAFEPRFENGTAITHPSVKNCSSRLRRSRFFSRSVLMKKSEAFKRQTCCKMQSTACFKLLTSRPMVMVFLR